MNFDFEYYEYAVNTGAKNMQIDEDLLNGAIENQSQKPIFRLYGWEPSCVSLGRNQKDDFVDTNLLKNNNIDIVRRLTGGRALLHSDELTYCIICPVSYLENGEHVVSSYKELSSFLIDTFENLGLTLDFGSSKPVKTGFDYCMLISTGADLCFNNKKLIGSAQCRKNGYILQHGSILYDYNRELLEKIFKEPVDTQNITSIKECAPNLTKEQIIDTFYKG